MLHLTNWSLLSTRFINESKTKGTTCLILIFSCPCFCSRRGLERRRRREIELLEEKEDRRKEADTLQVSQQAAWSMRDQPLTDAASLMAFEAAERAALDAQEMVDGGRAGMPTAAGQNAHPDAGPPANKKRLLRPAFQEEEEEEEKPKRMFVPIR
jgi:hypothetical protein